MPADTYGKRLFALIGESNPLQKKSLAVIAEALTPAEWEDLERTLVFYLERWSLEELAQSYLLFLSDTLEQTKFFVQHKRYRYSTFAEVEDLVYHDHEYMSKYMVGLALSSYLWNSHLDIARWFHEKLADLRGGAYLEIGPGHGRYFYAAISAGGFRQYDAIDLSEASVEQTREYVAHFAAGREASWRVFREDFYQYIPRGKYDCLVAMEVLEHLEQPQKMLEKMVLCGRPGGHILLTVPVNAPAIDHIYLFRSTGQVEDMVRAAGIEIVDRRYVTPSRSISLDRAARKDHAVIAGILGRIL